MSTIRINKSDYAGLDLKDDKWWIMATTPMNPKGVQKPYKRLARIKRNLYRELNALNKEMRRFPTDTPRGSL